MSVKLEIVEKLLPSHTGALLHRDQPIQNPAGISGGVEVAEARLNRFDARAQDEVGVDGNREAHRLELRRGHDRGSAALHHVRDLHAGERAPDFRQLLARARRLDEQGLGPGFVIGTRTP